MCVAFYCKKDNQTVSRAKTHKVCLVEEKPCPHLGLILVQEGYILEFHDLDSILFGSPSNALSEDNKAAGTTAAGPQSYV